jgi:hypothetical protein
MVATLEVPSAKQKFEAGRLIHDVTRDQLAAVLAALSASVAESYSADHDRA